MMKELALAGAFAGALLLLTACERNAEEKPALTREAFAQAVSKCGAKNAVFTENMAGSRLPVIAFTEGTSTGPSGSVRTSDCVAAEISAYGIEAMEIRFETSVPAKAS